MREEGERVSVLLDAYMLTVNTHESTLNKVDISMLMTNIGALIRPIRVGQHGNINQHRSIDH